jgi:hypothetical protein
MDLLGGVMNWAVDYSTPFDFIELLTGIIWREGAWPKETINALNAKAKHISNFLLLSIF